MNENASTHLGDSFPLDPGVLRRLHSSCIEDPATIRGVLDGLRDAGTVMTGKRTLRGEAETARILEVLESELAISAKDISRREGESVFLNFSLDGRSYFFSSAVLSVRAKNDPRRISIPSVLYVAERRDQPRRSSSSGAEVPRRVRLSNQLQSWTAEGRVEDYSPVGLNVRTGGKYEAATGDVIRVEYLDGSLAGERRWGQVRYAGNVVEPSGWLRLGLAVSEVQQGRPIGVERRSAITAAGPLNRARQRLAMLSAGATAVSAKVMRRSRVNRTLTDVRVVDYHNDRGEPLRGIIDSAGEPRGAIAVVIPPAWGRTKETLLPLALTIVETFRRAGEPVSVLRFDGTRRRGESYKERGFEAPGSECLKFTLGAAVADIRASAEFLTGPSVGAVGVILVTFSAASIEGRRAIVLDRGHHIRGWVSVVGSPDLQSGMRTVSGGVDYVAGAAQQIKFGVQEIMGVATDVDLLMGDALSARLPFLEDARRDMAEISTPVTWIHGANDAWLDLERVQVSMSCGNQRNRKLIEVPTGHQLRSSREALEVFQLVAGEVGEMALGRALPGAMPNLTALEAQRLAEKERLPRAATDVKAFWRDYLLGRGGALGIEFMNATQAFDDLMKVQIDCLRLRDGDRIADIGSGVGSFPLLLATQAGRPSTISIDEIDYIPDAFERARERLRSIALNGIHVNFLTTDLDDTEALSQRFLASTYDAALLSLVLSYVRDPRTVLQSVFRSLRPGGRVVVSSLRRDADISRLYLEGVDELRQGKARESLGSGAEKILDASVRSFLNDSARLLDLEEQGIFRFLDPEDIQSLVLEAGFESVTTALAFGDPSQAAVISAKKPA